MGAKEASVCSISSQNKAEREWLLHGRYLCALGTKELKDLELHVTVGYMELLPQSSKGQEQVTRQRKYFSFRRKQW